LPGPLQGSLPTWLGSALVGRDSHPLDDFSEFHEVIARSFLTSRAWSQRSPSTSETPRESGTIENWNTTRKLAVATKSSTTRAARHTMGSRQRAAIKGTVETEPMPADPAQM
jgi:hypothetical protein